jgi:hypothetical protein
VMKKIFDSMMKKHSEKWAQIFVCARFFLSI